MSMSSKSRRLLSAFLPAALLLCLPLGAAGGPEPPVALAPAPCPLVKWADLRLRNGTEPLCYPIFAQMQHISGEVTVQFRVSPKGAVQEAQALDGPEILRRPAVEFVRSHHFMPPMVDQKAGEVESKVRVRFQPTWREGAPTPKPLAGYVLHLTAVAGRVPNPDALALEKQVREWLAGMNLHPIKGTPPDPEGTLDLNLDVKCLKGEGGIFLEELTLRVSRSGPGLFPKAWTLTKMAGHRSPEVFKAAIQQALGGFTRDLGFPVPLAPPQASPEGQTAEGLTAPPQGPDPLPESDFKGFRIKRQPPPPPYPLKARGSRVQGTVVLEVAVNSKGIPTTAVALSGPGTLVDSAIGYALSWEFEPLVEGAMPRAQKLRLAMPFRLR